MRTLVLLAISCFTAFAQFPTVTRITPGDVTNPALYQTIESHRQDPTLGENQRRVTIHSRPVFYPDKDGLLQRIDTALGETVDLERLRPAIGNERNTVKFVLNDYGEALYSVNGHRLRVRLVERIEQPRSKEFDPIRETPTVGVGKISTSIAQIKRAFPDADIEYEAALGQIKERIIVSLPPMPESKTVRYRWTYDTELQPFVSNGTIDWCENGQTVMRFPAPIVLDAHQRAMDARWELEPDGISLVIDAVQLLKAAYPVVIDPTVTTDQSDAVYNRSIGDSAAPQWNHAFGQFALPDLTGAFSSIDSAVFRAYSYSQFIGVYADVYCDSVVDTGAWDESSTTGTLTGLTFNSATDTTVAVSTGSYTDFNILGTTATNGIIKIYEDDESPGASSVKLSWTDRNPTNNSVQTSLRLGYESGFGNPRVLWYARTDPTSYWRVEIVYTASGSATPNVSSGTVGVLIN